MAKNNKYLQYAKSRNKTQLNIDLQQIAIEFGRLLNKRFCYVFSGGIKVEFQFKMENFYHLLGFHKLTDVTIIKMVENMLLSQGWIKSDCLIFLWKMADMMVLFSWYIVMDLLTIKICVANCFGVLRISVNS